MNRLGFAPVLRIGFLTVMACVALTMLCGWAGGCGTDYHKATVAADSIAASLKTAADLNHSLAASGQISVEERQQVAALIIQASLANDALVADLKAAQTNGTPLTAASIAADFQAFLTQIDGLEKNGVLHLKSTAAQTQFESILTAIKTEVQVLQAVITLTSGRNQAPRSPQSGGYLIFAALALTPEEIEALIGLAISTFGEGAALVAKLTAMKGETDAALLADAAAEDAAARTEAQADEE